MNIGEAITNAFMTVTGPWVKLKKREEREIGALAREIARAAREEKVTIIEAAFEIIPWAYDHARGSFKFTYARQVFYSSRQHILNRTGVDDFNYDYFAYTILPAFLREHPDLTADWKICYDPRGNFTEPHTGLVVPLGTREVAEYCAAAPPSAAFSPPHVGASFPTRGPLHRFGAVVYIEKEGYRTLIEASGLTRRYDVGFAYGKGFSVAAVRDLFQSLDRGEVKFFAVHDFDPKGFEILRTLHEDTARYQFDRRITVVDAGLRLADVSHYGLTDEPFKVSNVARLRTQLLSNGATAEEAEYIAGRKRRVEINGLTNDQLLDLIERKLRANHVKKIIPGAEQMNAVYSRAVYAREMNQAIKDADARAQQVAASAAAPRNLGAQVKKLLKAEPALSWDDAVSRVAGLEVGDDGKENTDAEED